MNLNLSLFKDKETKVISIIAETDYPGLRFTDLRGANILENSDNKPVIRSMRKTMGVGLSLGYGAMYNINTKSIDTGPYIGVGVNWQPKFLQW